MRKLKPVFFVTYQAISKNGDTNVGGNKLKSDMELHPAGVYCIDLKKLVPYPNVAYMDVTEIEDTTELPIPVTTEPKAKAKK